MGSVLVLRQMFRHHGSLNYRHGGAGSGDRFTKTELNRPVDASLFTIAV